MAEPAYSRLSVDERRAQIVAAGTELFAKHSFEEISMREIAQAAGVSKPLLYHYFPSKIDLFKAAVAEAATELAQTIAPSGGGSTFEQLAASLDAYLAWIERNALTWTKLMESAATLPDAKEIVEGFREQTMRVVLAQLIGKRKARPALRTAIRGWLGYMDAAILDWTHQQDLSREQLRELLIAAFGSAILSAQHVDPRIQLSATPT